MRKTMYFGKMKYLLIYSLILVLFGCSSGSKEPFDGMEEFRKNRFDLKLTQSFEYKGIHFKLPTHFVEQNKNNFLLKAKGFGGKDSSINTYFSIEVFRPEEWNEWMPEDSLPVILNLEEMNAAYLHKRYVNYFKAGVSNTNGLKLRYPNRFQIIATKPLDSSKERYFAMATIEIKNKFYVFQYIAQPVLMDYVCDDFKRILRTVKQK